MFWRKVFHVLVVSVLLLGTIVSPSVAGESKSMAKIPRVKQPNATYTVCASGCDFSSIQTAIDTVNPGDTLSLAGETFTETITIDKDLTIEGAGAESTIVQAADAPGIATSRVITVTNSVTVTIQDISVRFGVAFNLQHVDGGGIYNEGILHISQSAILSNTASVYGGGIANFGTLVLDQSDVNQNSASEGGGLYNEGNLTISNCTIEGNSGGRGGGIATKNIISITDCDINNNTAWDFGGGGIHSIADDNKFSLITISNSTIFSNTSEHDRGGGIYISDYGSGISAITITISTISSNQARYGGGMYSNSSDVFIRNVTFSDNHSDYNGGGFLGMSEDPTLTNVVFSHNTANRNGGGLYHYSGDPTLTNIVFSHNTADGDGGGLHHYSGDLTLNNVTFDENSATRGGGIWFESSSPTMINVLFEGNSAFEGGGMYSWYSTTDIRNATYSNNSATHYGGGILNISSLLTLTNAILWGNDATTGSQIYAYPGPEDDIKISNSNIQSSGGSGAGWDSSLGTDGGSNIDADPLFLDTLNGDLHLGAGSPAIDAGNNLFCPSHDLDGVPRPQGVGCDIGAYEFVGISFRKQANTAITIPGETITFTIQVVNSMTETVTGGVISDTLPAGLNFIGPTTLEPPLSGTVGSAPPTLVTDLEIGAGQQITVTFPVSVALNLPIGTIITNTAWITTNEVITPILGSTILTVISGAPVAVDDSGPTFTTDEKSAFVTGNVLDNDYDPKGDPLYLLNYDDSNIIGLLTSFGDGTFDYDPDDQFGYLGTNEQALEVFSYTVGDGVLTDTATVTITIMGVNDPPVAVNNSGIDFETNEDTSFTTGNVLDNDYDPDTNDVLFVSHYNDTNLSGLLTHNGDGTFDYDPNGQFDFLAPGEQAADLFTYLVSDGHGGTDTGIVTITVTGLNDIPIVNAGPDQTVAEGALVQFEGSYTDPDHTNPAIHWDFGDGSTATGILTPTHTYLDNGAYTATLTVTDTLGAVGSDWLVVTVENVAPILSEFPDLEITAGETITVTGTITDPGVLDTQTVVITWGDGVTETLELAATERQFAVTHTYAAPGSYTAIVRATDKDGGWDEQDFNVAVSVTGYWIFLPFIER